MSRPPSPPEWVQMRMSELARQAGAQVGDGLVPLPGLTNWVARLETDLGPVVVTVPRRSAVTSPTAHGPGAAGPAVAAAAAAGMCPAILYVDPDGSTVRPYWEGTPLEHLPRPQWRVHLAAVGALIDEVRTLPTAGLDDMNLTALIEHCLSIEPDPTVRSALELLIDEGARLDAEVASTGGCMVHGDLWGGNVLVRSDNSLALIDWEFAARGHPALDAAYFAELSDLTPGEVGLTCPHEAGRLDPLRPFAQAIVLGWSHRHPEHPEWGDRARDRLRQWGGPLSAV